MSSDRQYLLYGKRSSPALYVGGTSRSRARKTVAYISLTALSLFICVAIINQQYSSKLPSHTAHNIHRDFQYSPFVKSSKDFFGSLETADVAKAAAAFSTIGGGFDAVLPPAAISRSPVTGILDAEVERQKILRRRHWSTYSTSLAGKIPEIGEIYERCDESQKMIVGKIYLKNVTVDSNNISHAELFIAASPTKSLSNITKFQAKYSINGATPVVINPCDNGGNPIFPCLKKFQTNSTITRSYDSQISINQEIYGAIYEHATNTTLLCFTYKLYSHDTAAISTNLNRL